MENHVTLDNDFVWCTSWTSYLELTLFSLNQFLMFCLTTHVFQMTEKTKKKLQKYIKKCGKSK